MIFLLPVTDPIVIMRNRDVKEIMKNYRAKMIHKWRPQKAVPQQNTLESVV